MKVVDFFCGAGGFSEGFERAGFEIIRAYDIWGPAIITHNQNHGKGTNPAKKRDVYEISILDDEEFEKAVPDSEIIIGSPPCVAFSNSNKSGKADKTNGVKLINAYLRIVARKLAKPNSILKYWVMENVVNSEKYVAENYNAKDLEWYQLGDFVLKIPKKETYNMKNFGVPTNRKRFICGNFPELKPLNNDNEVIDLGEILNNLGFPNPTGYRDDHQIVVDPIYGIKVKVKDLTDYHYIKEIAEFEWKKARRQKEDKGYMGKMAFPENKDKPARTIMATLSASSRESMIFELDKKQERYRYPTIREVATLMSFPIDFRFYGDSDTTKYRMVGNAVTPKFSYEIAKCIRENLIKKSIIKVKDRFSEKKIFDEEIPFTNLNGNIFELKQEKEKKFNANFNRHVPYLIKKGFRVALNNKFECGKLIWGVKIHYSQGKNAKVYEDITLNKIVFNEKENKNMYIFINNYIERIRSFKKLQSVYCMTTKTRDSSIGPDELLQATKEFVESLEERLIFVEEIGKSLSSHIVISYYVLINITLGLDRDEVIS